MFYFAKDFLVLYVCSSSLIFLKISLFTKFFYSTAVRVSELEQPARLVSSAATISADTIRFIPSLSLSVGVSVVFPCAAS